MSLEIERKFLVKNDDYKREAYQKKEMKQGYLNADKNRTVRIRINNDKGFITIKGKSNRSGTTRFEWEKEILLAEAEALLKLCEPTIIEKVRYIINANDNLFFEVDEFFGANKGLLIAEIELPTEDTVFTKPKWLGKEVTGEAKYYNASLSKKPYTNW